MSGTASHLYSPSLSPFRRERYLLLKRYFDESDKTDYEANQTLQIMRDFKVFVKETIQTESEVALMLSRAAVEEGFGGIVLCFGRYISDDNTHYIFLEYSPEEDKTKWKGVVHAMVWMLEHGIIHADLKKNNIFKMEDVVDGNPVVLYVAGDFDMVLVSNDLLAQFKALSYFIDDVSVYPDDIVVSIRGLKRYYKYNQTEVLPQIDIKLRELQVTARLKKASWTEADIKNAEMQKTSLLALKDDVKGIDTNEVQLNEQFMLLQEILLKVGNDFYTKIYGEA